VNGFEKACWELHCDADDEQRDLRPADVARVCATFAAWGCTEQHIRDEINRQIKSGREQDAAAAGRARDTGGLYSLHGEGNE